MNLTEVTSVENDTLFTEKVFHKMLILERKKTERSGRPFLLILLNLEKILQEKKLPKDLVMQKLTAALDDSTREIDLKGWYRSDSILGVLCTDVGREKKNAVATKVKSKLVSVFGASDVKAISMYLIDYPEYETHANRASPGNVIEELQPERKGMFFS